MKTGAWIIAGMLMLVGWKGCGSQQFTKRTCPDGTNHCKVVTVTATKNAQGQVTDCQVNHKRVELEVADGEQMQWCTSAAAGTLDIDFSGGAGTPNSGPFQDPTNPIAVNVPASTSNCTAWEVPPAANGGHDYVLRIVNGAQPVKCSDPKVIFK
jgi:hypothetical protein